MTATPCQHCAEPIAAGHRFCGMCGAPNVSDPPTAATALWAAPEAATAVYAAAPSPVYPPVHSPAPTVTAPPSPGVLRRYRGPLWTGGIGLVLLLAGSAVVSAILSAVQLEGTGMLVDLFGPLVEDQVEGTIGVDVVDLGDSGSGLSMVTLIAFVSAGIVGLIGLIMVIVGCAWAASRGLGGRGSGTVTIATPPAPVDYDRPSFSRATPPTYTQPTPPEQLPPSPPTFTTRGPR